MQLHDNITIITMLLVICKNHKLCPVLDHYSLIVQSLIYYSDRYIRGLQYHIHLYGCLLEL